MRGPTVPYLRMAQYYETDQMGYVHHSNFIRWFEEARVDFMAQAGFSYGRLESEGIASPVLSMHVDYKTPVRFGDTVRIHVDLEELERVRIKVRYLVVDEKTGETRCSGYSTHCYINSIGRPVSLQKASPELFQIFREAVGINAGAFSPTPNTVQDV